MWTKGGRESSRTSNRIPIRHKLKLKSLFEIWKFCCWLVRSALMRIAPTHQSKSFTDQPVDNSSTHMAWRKRSCLMKRARFVSSARIQCTANVPQTRGGKSKRGVRYRFPGAQPPSQYYPQVLSCRHRSILHAFRSISHSLESIRAEEMRAEDGILGDIAALSLAQQSE